MQGQPSKYISMLSQTVRKGLSFFAEKSEIQNNLIWLYAVVFGNITIDSKVCAVI